MMRWLTMALAAAALGVLSGPAEFAEHYSGGRWRSAKHLRLISDTIADAVYAQQGAIVIIEAPPRHGKSELVSHWTPTWFHNTFPDEAVALAAYEAKLAREWGRKVRDEHERIGEITLKADSQAADYWHTDEGGSFVTAGVGGPMTGKNAKLFIVDDPIKNAEEADSEVMRDKIWDWWQTVAWSRRQPGTVYVVMHTRWHEDDLVGRLLALAEREPLIAKLIIRIQLPAIAEEDDSSDQKADLEKRKPGDVVRTLRMGRAPGVALWPERFPNDDTPDGLQTTKAGYTERWWIALFQQRPSATEGNEIKRAWWRYYKELPVPLEHFDFRVISVDCSFKDEETSDFVVLGAGGAYGAQRYMFDVHREQMDVIKTCQAIREMAMRTQPHAILVEARANGDAVMQVLRNEFPQLLAVDPLGGKQARARAAAPQICAGNVLLPNNAQWCDSLVSEHAAFPRGKYDDQVDMMSQLLLFLLHWKVNHSEALAGFDRINTPAVQKAVNEAVHGKPLFSIRPAFRRST